MAHPQLAANRLHIDFHDHLAVPQHKGDCRVLVARADLSQDLHLARFQLRRPLLRARKVLHRHIERVPGHQPQRVLQYLLRGGLGGARLVAWMVVCLGRHPDSGDADLPTRSGAA